MKDKKRFTRYWLCICLFRLSFLFIKKTKKINTCVIWFNYYNNSYLWIFFLLLFSLCILFMKNYADYQFRLKTFLSIEKTKREYFKWHFFVYKTLLIFFLSIKNGFTGAKKNFRSFTTHCWCWEKVDFTFFCHNIILYLL
jgi:hypothetical protein